MILAALTLIALLTVLLVTSVALIARDLSTTWPSNSGPAGPASTAVPVSV